MSDVKFVDAETEISTDEKGFTFKLIVLSHLQKIAGLESKEMRGGYFTTKNTILPNGIALTEQIYVPDTREEFAGAVNYLADILLPHFDKVMKGKEQELDKEEKELREKYLKLLQGVTETAIMPDLDIGKGSTDEKTLVEKFRAEKFSIKRKLFRELSMFLHRTHYLGAGEMEDIM